MHSIALVGNPNCGKTTLFNALTGSNQYVGNWAGVTVEKRVSHMSNRNRHHKFRHRGNHSHHYQQKIKNFDIVDLPGIYSLSPYSMEEKLARDYIINENPDAIINIIDGSNIERNLYLTVQLIELNKPMVLAVNMMDDVKANGGNIDCIYLSKLLGMPVVPISARRNENIDKVIEKVQEVIKAKSIPPEINYDINTQNALNEIYSVIVRNCELDLPYAHFAAKLLEGDNTVKDALKLKDKQLEHIEEIVTRYEKTSSYGDREAMLADARYTFIADVVKKTVIKGKNSDKLTVSDKIDMFVTNRFLAIPIFLLIMLGMFSLVFGPVGSYLSDLIDKLFNNMLSPAVEKILTAANAPQWTFSLLIDAVISGVGGILTFLPQIALLFLCLSFLEDSGYMARAAFITDRFLRRLGLSGKSFIPMLMGFGCTTPAVMATRTTENINERRLTIMLVPFMSCGAKLPIYALFAGLFFAQHQGLVVFSMYLIGFVVAILVGLILHKTVFKGNMAPFVMELPTYRMPMPSSILKNTWEKCKGFIVKAGTIIFSMSVLIWLLQTYTPSFNVATDSTQSMFGIIGAFIAPVLIPLGFGTWQAGVSILSGLVAKEAVVSSMIVLYSVSNETELMSVLSGVFTPLSAFTFMLFCLLYVPCISAFVTIKREMGSWKWAFASAGIQIGIAYLISLLVYQIGSVFIK